MSESAAVAVRRTGYPQVDPRAAGLMHRGLIVVPPQITVAEAARLGARRHGRLVAARVDRTWAGASPETLAHALGLGLGTAPLAAILWDTVLVAPDTPEVAVRRWLGPGRPFVLVAGPRGPVGVVFREAAAPPALPLSIALRLEQLPARLREILRTAGTLGDLLGLPVAAVGGLVRDLLMDRVHERTDLDLVVEGSAATLAQRLAASLEGQAVQHVAFLTATVALADGRRIDLATARRESYRAPGALPAVEPATLVEDLARRDFSLNALAVRLDRAGWGQLVDMTGGLADLRARRIRVLHPLSFLEDPTRIVRAARLAARLRCRVDRMTRRLAAHAAALDVYRALSGDRLRAELELVLAEPRPASALREAGRLGAWRLVHRDTRAGRRATRLVAAALRPRALEGLGPDTPIALTLLALTEGGAAVETWANRFALAPALCEAIRQARSDAPRLGARLAHTRGRAGAYAILQGVPEVTAAWARVLAGDGARRHLDAYLRSWRRLRSLATGDDIAALGIPPGPAVGKLLGKLRAAQAAGAIRSRAGALRWLRGVAARGAGGARVGEALLSRADRGGG
jgi:tRNA nucleotidyltransferase (CCA-adding enzyme)